MGGMVEFLASPEMIELVFSDPAAAVREGGASGLANLAPDNPVWVKFARAMGPGAMRNAQTIAEMVTAWPVPPRKVLDIAAGHGMYGIMLLKAIPQAKLLGVLLTCVPEWPLAMYRSSAYYYQARDRRTGRRGAPGNKIFMESRKR